MDYIYLIASSVLILTCFYFIVSPFFTPKEGVKSSRNDDQLTLEDVYTAVNELEMDYLMKKMTEKDFLQLKEKYQIMAAELIKQERLNIRKKSSGQKRTDTEVELEILRELQNLRKQKGRS